VIKFENDDEGYKDWLRRNPNGYVINCFRSPSPNYLFLHKATCFTISGSPEGTHGPVDNILKFVLMKRQSLKDGQERRLGEVFIIVGIVNHDVS